MSLWFGTPDAPAPDEAVPANKPLPITIGISPQHACYVVTLLYRISKRSEKPKELPAKWILSDSFGKAQYYQAYLPPFQSGSIVEYTAVCRCEGQQVQSPEDAEKLASFFRVRGIQAISDTAGDLNVAVAEDGLGIQVATREFQSP